MHNIRIPLTSHARSKSSFEVVEAIKFFSFLRKVGSSHNVKVSYRKKTEVDFISMAENSGLLSPVMNARH